MKHANLPRAKVCALVCLLFAQVMPPAAAQFGPLLPTPEALQPELDAIAAAPVGSALRQQLADRFCKRLGGPMVVALFTPSGVLICRPPATQRKVTPA